MKKIYLIFTAILFLTLQLQAQTPNALSYQGVARDAAGLVLSNQAIGLRFTIHQGNAGGTVVYQETQSTTTNLLGLFTVAIGKGTLISGSFSGIGWGSNKEYLQVEMDAVGGTAYLNMGTNEFLSVPYAVTAGSSTSSWNLTGNSSTNGTNYIGTTDANDVIFKAHNNEVMRISNTSNNVGIGTPTPDPGAALDVTSSTKGFLIPRMASNPANPVQGMMYYNTTSGCFLFYTGTAWDAMVCPCPNPIGTPGAISGITTFCPSSSGVSYSVAPVSNATSYAWTIPSGVGTIASGIGSNAITLNTSNTSGTITVAAVNNCGAGNVSSLALTAATLPGITTSPSNAAIVNGSAANFSVVATGTGLTYQWQLNSGSGFANISGANSATYNIPSVSTGMDGYQFRVIVTGTCGTPQTSGTATLTVCPGAVTTPGTIGGLNPFCPSTNGVAYSVASVTFATSYTWTVPSGVGIVASGAGTASITVNTSTSSGTISVTASNACGTSSASSLALTVGTSPAISVQPGNLAVNAPATATFSVTASGAGLTYQWQLNSGSGYAPISGATNSSYNIPSTTTGMNGGLYRVVISGSCGSPITSNAATLTVCGGALGSTGTITGPTPVCPSSQAVYSIPSVANATNYTWTVPSGSTILAGAGTFSITVTTGTTSGNITVFPFNGCSNGTTASLPITVTTGGPVITVQPKGTASVGGATATFSVTATSATGYQWQVSTDGGSTYTPLTNTAPYSNVTTNTLTITSPTVGMNGYLYNVVVTGTGGCATATSLAAALGVCSNPEVQIAVPNTGTSPTPLNMVVKVPVNFSSYTTYGEHTNLDNIEFTANASATNSGTPLYAWIENGSAASSTAASVPSSSSTAPIVWVNLGANSIPVGGTLYIYLNFMGSAVMTASTTGASTGYTGMAPQLTGSTLPTYGQYDNGALVFSFYDNFAGTTLNSSNWTTFHSGTGNGTMTVSNKITFTTSNGGTETNVITTANTFSGHLFAELYEFNTNGSSGGQRSYMPGLTMNSATTEGNNIADNAPMNQPNDYSMSFCDGKNGTPNVYCTIQGDYPVNFEPTYTQPTGFNVMGLGYNLSSTDLWYINYSTVNGGTTSFQPTGNLYYALGTQNGTGTTMGFSAYWSRVRVIPTSGTVPTPSISGVGCY